MTFHSTLAPNSNGFEVLDADLDGDDDVVTRTGSPVHLLGVWLTRGTGRSFGFNVEFARGSTVSPILGVTDFLLSGELLVLAWATWTSSKCQVQ